MDSSASVAQRFKERVLHTYFVRCDMSLILLVVVAAGVGSSKLMLECGVRSLPVRYPLALLISFVAFLALIRVWIWYIFCRKPAGLPNLDLDSLPLPRGGGGGSGSVRFGGGNSGGAGASGSWEDAGNAPKLSSSGGGFEFDFDLGDDWAIVALLIALVLAIVCSGGYLIYAAPNILPEAAWQATLAAGLARVPKPSDRQGWMGCVLKASVLPFAAVLVMVVALAWVARSHCPQAVKLAEALSCSQ